MTRFRLILRNLVFHRTSHLAVALGVVVSVAVLTGAFIIGDSMQQSLRTLALDRLGRVDVALQSPRFFRAELADEIAADQGVKKHFSDIVPAIFSNVIPAEAGTHETGSPRDPRRDAWAFGPPCYQ